jgi:hypothetical protein
MSDVSMFLTNGVCLQSKRRMYTVRRCAHNSQYKVWKGSLVRLWRTQDDGRGR